LKEKLRKIHKKEKLSHLEKGLEVKKVLLKRLKLQLKGTKYANTM